MIEMDINRAREIVRRKLWEDPEMNVPTQIDAKARSEGFIAGYESHRESKELKDLVEALESVSKNAHTQLDRTFAKLALDNFRKATGQPFLNTRQDDEAGEV